MRKQTCFYSVAIRAVSAHSCYKGNSTRSEKARRVSRRPHLSWNKGALGLGSCKNSRSIDYAITDSDNRSWITFCESLSQWSVRRASKLAADRSKVAMTARLASVYL